MTSNRFSIADRRARLVHRHRLARSQRCGDPAEIADDLVALHSSDPASVYLSLAARSDGPAERAIDAVAAALHDERRLVRLHAMRRTIWVTTRPFAPVVHAACAASLAANEWRTTSTWIARSGYDEPEVFLRERSRELLESLERDGPATARQLGRRAPHLAVKFTAGSGKYTGEQALHTRLLLNLGFDATIVRGETVGGWTSSEYVWYPTELWLGHPIAGAERDGAITDLVGRYLARFGPATTEDIRWWTGLTAAAVKPALATCGAEPCRLEVDVGVDRDGWVLPGYGDVPAVDGSAVLLPALDPTAMGWKHRRWCYGDDETLGATLFDRNGNVGPTIWVDGAPVGAWAQRADGAIARELLRPVTAARRRAIEAAAERLQAVIGDGRVTPRFPTPLQRRLVS